jgi:RNA polymerase sigma factor (sigma-70 family)
MANFRSSDTEGATPESLDWLDVFERQIASSLENDYLSNQIGHQQSRRVLAERSAASLLQRDVERAAPDSARYGTSRSGAHIESDAERAYLQMLSRARRLTSREEYLLAKRLKAGDAQARDVLIEATLWLPVLLAKRLRGNQGVPLLDLVSEGNMGLFLAAKTFDPERGFRFSTYAKSAVRQCIVRSLARTSSLAAAAGHAEWDLHKDSTPAGTDSNNKPNRELEHTWVADQAPPEETLVAPQDRASKPAGDALWFDKAQVYDFVSAQTPQAQEAPCEDEPYYAVHLKKRLEVLVQALNKLNERERTVIVERYALTGKEPTTLETLAARFDVSIERIRQIEVACLHKLRVSLAAGGETADTML